MNRHHRHKPFIVPVFIPHAGCPHQCLFCDQTRTTNRKRGLPSDCQVEAQISRFLSYRRHHDRWTEIAFFGGNFLGLAESQIVRLLDVAAPYIRTGRVQGIRFSTRPDTIDDNRLELIRNYPVSTIEIGAQSMHAPTLKLSRRGHGPDATVKAIKLLKNKALHIGLQAMVGLPGESEQTAMASAQQMAGLEPDFVRIYPCLVLRDSPLARWYYNGRYIPWSLEKSVCLVKRIYRLMSSRKIAVIRMGLQPTTELAAGTGVLAGPFHPAFGDLVYSALWMDTLGRTLASSGVHGRDVTIEVHPTSSSRIRGHRNDNLKRLRRQYCLQHVNIQPNARLPHDLAMVNGVCCPMIPDESSGTISAKIP
jgi:histone acetyltransferase (RNA polymerase elongator complex component)